MSFLLLLLLGALSANASAESQSAVVVVPVADVWSRPLAVGEKPSDDLRETQVLSGEKVHIHESTGPWVQIEAIEQPTFRQHNQWEGYPGWILKTTLGKNIDLNWPNPWPARLSVWLKKNPYYWSQILYAADRLVGTPYLWGGLSEHGIDCSGLVHLSYRTDGFRIPRDAHEQWMKAKPIKRVDLKPADLIFSAKANNPKIITHVAIYVRDEQIIEAPQTGMVVRKISFKEKYGKELSKVESGDKVGDRVIYFGSFLH